MHGSRSCWQLFFGETFRGNQNRQATALRARQAFPLSLHSFLLRSRVIIENFESLASPLGHQKQIPPLIARLSCPAPFKASSRLPGGQIVRTKSRCSMHLDRRDRIGQIKRTCLAYQASTRITSTSSCRPPGCCAWYASVPRSPFAVAFILHRVAYHNQLQTVCASM